MANLPYIQAVSETTQIITLADTPQPIILDKVDDKNEFDLDTSTGIITYNKQGAARKFFYMITPQVVRENNCKDSIPNFRCWLQFRSSDSEEFVDMEDTNVLLNVNTIRKTKDVIPLQGLITLEHGNQLRFAMASNFDNEVKIEYIEMTGEPDVPSVIVSIANIGLEKDEPTTLKASAPKIKTETKK